LIVEFEFDFDVSIVEITVVELFIVELFFVTLTCCEVIILRLKNKNDIKIKVNIFPFKFFFIKNFIKKFENLFFIKKIFLPIYYIKLNYIK
jgi:hypothetical protein